MRSTKVLICVILLLSFLTSCSDKNEIEPIKPEKYNDIKDDIINSSIPNTMGLPVYFEIENIQGSFITYFDYFENSKVSRSTQYFPNGEVETHKNYFYDENDVTGRYESFDKDGYIGEIYSYKTVSENRLSKVLPYNYEFAYDNHGRIAQVEKYEERASGRIRITSIEWEYNEFGNLAKEIIYNVEGVENPIPIKEILYSYDSNISLTEGVSYFPSQIFPRVPVGMNGLFWSGNNLTKKVIRNLLNGSERVIDIEYMYTNEGKPLEYTIYVDGNKDDKIIVHY